MGSIGDRPHAVSVSLRELQDGTASLETLEQAFGPASLGIIIVQELPEKFAELRREVRRGNEDAVPWLLQHARNEPHEGIGRLGQEERDGAERGDIEVARLAHAALLLLRREEEQRDAAAADGD